MSNDRRRRELIEQVGMAFRMHQNAGEIVDDAAAESLGINRTDARCLDIIDQHGKLTAGQLAAETRLTTGAITTALDRLEGAGYIRRLRDEGDRRKVLVQLTDKARRRAWEIYGPLAEWGAEELNRYSDEQLGFILEFMRRGRDLMIEHAERVRKKTRRGQRPKAK